uniref:Uncharacterized protein n=1 Tax=Anguilla anguilla TaxID=7936 RepID=A0A0E9XFS1_ANGAN
MMIKLSALDPISLLPSRYCYFLSCLHLHQSKNCVGLAFTAWSD